MNLPSELVGRFSHLQGSLRRRESCGGRGEAAPPPALCSGGGERGTGQAGRRGAWSAASSSQRSALGRAASLRPHGRASGGPIEGRHRVSEASGA